jgi:hypothetical protein
VHKERTYIDRDELADFLADHVANDLPKLQHVLGTRPAVYTRIETQVEAGLSSIARAVSGLLSDWIAQQGPTGSAVFCLCYGSVADAVGTGRSEGLRIHGFIRAIGIERILTYFVKAF